jgi:hypothetical protein
MTMTNTTETIEEIKDELNRKLDLGLALSKAEGNLNFLAESTNTEGDKTLSITQGMAILDTLHAVQEARKAYQAVIYKERKAN